jgi:hypothetical protein
VHRCLAPNLFRRYTAALALQNDDIETLTNLGDCLVRRAELQCRPLSSDSTPEEWEHARPLYERATEAYGASCSLADARLGDDLTGLLINWGAGLYSAAQVRQYACAMCLSPCRVVFTCAGEESSNVDANV